MSGKENYQDKDNQDPSGNNADSGGSGKVANAHNSAGDKAPTQLHQGQRTPGSRGDRDSHIGSGNQMQSRQGGAGSSGGGGGRGAG